MRFVGTAACIRRVVEVFANFEVQHDRSERDQELKVYPPIGIARVGNAGGPNDYVIGPELIGGPPTLPGSGPEQPARYVGDFRTAKGEIKRQAARFRIYAHMKDGSVQEVTADDRRRSNGASP